MSTAHQVDVTDPEERNQEVYQPRSREDLEEIIGSMHEVEDEDVEEAVRQISSIADDNLRTGQNSVGDHFRAPIRSLTNPTENTVQRQEAYRPEDGTVLSDPEAVQAFNSMMNDEQEPEAEVVAEEYFVGNQLPGFQDVGNIKWWTVMEDGSYREETRNGGLEHLQLNNEGEISSFRVELDGEPLDPEQVRHLQRNLSARAEANQPITEENTVPEAVMRYDSRQELLENEDLTEQEYREQVQKAQRDGMITEEGDLTLRGWITGTDLHARDLRELEEVHDGRETVNFQDDSYTGLDLEQAELESRIDIDTRTNYVTNRVLDEARETARFDPENGEIPEEIQQVMRRFQRIGLDPEADPTERQEAEGEIGLMEYLSEFQDVNLEQTGEDSFKLYRDEVDSDRLFRNFSGSALSYRPGDVTVADTEINEYELSLEVIDMETGDEIPVEESDTPYELLQEMVERADETIDFKSGERFHVETELGTAGGDEFSTWTSEADTDDTTTVNFEGEISRSLPQYGLKLKDHENEIERLKEEYDGAERFTHTFHEHIPNYHGASEGLKQAVEELEERGLVETEMDEEDPAEVEITAQDPIEYRSALEELKQIEQSSFRTQRVKNYTEQRVPLDSVTAEVEIDGELTEDQKEKLETVSEELKEEGYLKSSWETRREPKVSLDIDDAISSWAHNNVGFIAEKLEGTTQKIKEEAREADLFKTLYTDSETVEVTDLESLEGEVPYEEPDISEEALDTLGELYEEGAIDVEIDYDKDETWERNNYPEPEKMTISDYHELEEEQRNRLQEMDREGLIDLEGSNYMLKLDNQIESRERIKMNLEGEAEVTEVEVEGGEVTVQAEYENTDEVYDADETVQTIASHLDPMNLESDPYEEVTLPTQFQYGEEITA